MPDADYRDVPSEPSNTVRRAANCASKVRHPNRASARRARRARRLVTEDGLSIYRCPICAGYHLTSQPRPWSPTDPEAA